jgi:nucleoside-diphosphate-sugar epimerase
MRVFVTGASGFIGSAVVPELLGAGHQVVGLARSDASAAALEAAGAEVRPGDLDDLDSLRLGAKESDAVIHLAYVHDFSQMEAAAQTDLRAIEALGGALEGSGKPLAIASGTLGLNPGQVGTERDEPAAVHPRVANALATLALADRGVRPLVVRLSPTVHGEGDHGFIAVLVQIARDKGVSGYIGDGSNRWNAVHRLDAARLFRLAVEEAPAGSVLHAVAEEGVSVRAIAEVVGQQLDLPVVSVPADEATDHFGWLGGFLGMDSPASSALTRQLLGWEPTGPGLLEDIAQHYV